MLVYSTLNICIFEAFQIIDFLFCFYPDGGTFYTQETNELHSLVSIRKKNNKIGLEDENDNVKFT